MNYSENFESDLLLQMAADAYAKLVQPDCYDLREAIRMKDIANEAGLYSDSPNNTLAFAVFIRAAKMAGLKPRHILAWIARNWGTDPIRHFASAELRMVHSSRKVS